HQPPAWEALVPPSAEFSSAKEDSFALASDYSAVRKAMAIDGNASERYLRGPFAEFGAFRRISGWVETELNRHAMRWEGKFSQFNATPSFSLIRFPTNRGAAWFKAVGEPNLREFPVAQLLGERFPFHVPELLAAKPEWNAWLTAESKGDD